MTAERGIQNKSRQLLEQPRQSLGRKWLDQGRYRLLAVSMTILFLTSQSPLDVGAVPLAEHRMCQASHLSNPNVVL